MTETNHDGYNRLLEDFGQRLDAAAARRRAARRIRGSMTAGAMALAGIGAGVVILTGAGGGGRLDLMAQAKAALVPAGEIVHLITTTHDETQGGSQAEMGPSSVAEQWSTSGPLRWRFATSLSPPTTTPAGKPLGNLHGLVTGAVQFSYGDGTAEAYSQKLNVLEVTTGVSDDAPQAAGYAPGELGIEPVAKVRAMLEAGQLHDAGSATVDGQTVRRLVGNMPVPALQRLVEPHANTGPWPVEYDINPETYAPVRVTVRRIGATPTGSTRIPVVIVDVNKYELIPLNDTTAPLLSIRPASNPTVHHHQASASPAVHLR